MNYGDIWKKLSGIDVSSHIEKKMNLSYLSWAWAWGVLMDNYPQAQYEFMENVIHADGSVDVWVKLSIDDCYRVMWLPVMDHKNNAIKNPDARKISDTRMRCLVKCIAMFGLGHYIYAGEDLPSSDTPKEPEAPKPVITQEQFDTLGELIIETQTEAPKFCTAFGIKSLSELPADSFNKALEALNRKKELAAKGMN